MYLLREVFWDTDAEAEAMDPMVDRGTLRVPRIGCSRCGIFASVGWLRPRVPLSEADAQPFRGKRIVRADEWEANRAAWSRLLGIPSDRVRPGHVIGPPEGDFRQARYPEVFIAGIGLLWVANSIRRDLEAVQIRGVRFHHVRDIGTDRDSGYSEIEVERALMRVDHPGIETVRCPECGRIRFLEEVPNVIRRVDAESVDIAYIDPGTRLTVVSERVKSAFDRAAWLQISLTPIEVH
jgi:hypothetical protein